jgi:hypothetical protein
VPGWVAPAALIGLAFAFRVTVGYFFSQYGGDAPGYTVLARSLAAGHGYSIAHQAPYIATDVRVPAYSSLLAVAFRINSSHWAVIVLNALLGALSTFFVWHIARGLQLRGKLALWSMGIAAFCFATASFAGIAQSENLSVAAVLAFVCFVLVKPPRNLVAFFILGSVLAWIVALTRDELAIFVALTAIVVARRMRLKFPVAVLLVACFLFGPGAWVLRNQVQVHRTELVDPIMSDSVILATLNGQDFSAPFYVESQSMAFDPHTTQAQRDHFQQQVDAYTKHMLLHEPFVVVEHQATYYLEALFPVPVYGITYVSTSQFLERCLWSLFLLAEYVLAGVALFQWWKSGRRRDVISVALFPMFMLGFMVCIEPQPRFWLPSVLLLLPPAVEAAANLDYRALATKLTAATPERPPISCNGGTMPNKESDKVAAHH